MNISQTEINNVDNYQEIILLLKDAGFIEDNQ